MVDREKSIKYIFNVLQMSKYLRLERVLLEINELIGSRCDFRR